MTSVSVIVPTYEREELLRQALDSALAQTYDDFVLLIGDNSESDGTERLVATYDDPRIRYHRNRPGLGGQGNWLDLVKRADTPLIASLHDDDTWDPEFLEVTVPTMIDDPSIAMFFTDFWSVDPDGNRLEEHTYLESARTHRASIPWGRLEYDLAEGLRLVAVWNAPQPAYAAVVRREPILAMEFPPDIEPLYDIWITYQLVKAGHPFHYNSRRLTNYRIHPVSITGAGFALAEDNLFRRILEDNPGAGEVLDEIRAYWADLQWSRATELMAGGSADRARSQQQLRESIDGLSGPKRAAATVGGHVGPAWHALRLVREARHRIEGRIADDD